MKRLLVLLPLLLTPAAAYANEIRMSCKGELDYSAITGSKKAIEVITESFQEDGIFDATWDIVINKNSGVSFAINPSDEQSPNDRAPFIETPTHYLMEFKDRSNPMWDQKRKHQVNRTDGGYTFTWEVRRPEDGVLVWSTPFFGKCIRQKRVKTLF